MNYLSRFITFLRICHKVIFSDTWHNYKQIFEWYKNMDHQSTRYRDIMPQISLQNADY